MLVLKALFWGSAAALAWTHAGYPVAAAALARVRSRPLRRGPVEPTVSVIVAAHDEEPVIERRIANLRTLDYPPGKLELVVTSDASTDRTEELAEAAGARVIRNPRGGKVAAQNRAVRETSGEILAFSDANAVWAPDALRTLVRNFADPEVAYVCGHVLLGEPGGTNREGVYWRYEHWLRANESRLGSVTGGVGPIYAVRREDYVEVDPRFGHDLSFPYLMVQRGRRAVFDPDALAFEQPAPDLEIEYRRKIRMLEHCWLITLRGRMLRELPPLYLAEVVSHRVLRYGSGILHLVLLASSAALVRSGPVYALAAGGQAAFLAAAAARPGLPRYYTLVTWATVVALANYLRRGVPATWQAAEGTR